MSYITQGDGKTFNLDVKGMKAAGYGLFVAMPVGKEIPPATAMSLLKLQAEWSKLPLPFKVHFHAGNSLVGLARNLCVAEFLSSSYSHILFIDSDLIFQPDDPLRMMAADLDMLGGSYARRFLFWDKVVEAAKAGRFDDLDTAGCIRTGEAMPGGERLPYAVEATQLPGGFLMIKREVFLRIIQNRPDLKFTTGEDLPCENWVYDFFASGVDDKNAYHGEDYAFCDLVRANGFRIWLDTMARIGHIGTHVFWSDPAVAELVADLKAA